MAFEQFKEECGSEINRIFKENKSILLARRKRSSTVARRINTIKQEMEDIKKALEAQRQERSQQGKSLHAEWPVRTWQERELLVSEQFQWWDHNTPLLLAILYALAVQRALWLAT